MKNATKIIKFDYAHRLKGNNGELYDKDKCGSIHGHTGKLEVSIEKRVITPQEDNEFNERYEHDRNFDFVTDFSNFKVIRDWIDENIDHALVVSNNDKSLKEFCEKEDMNIFVMPSQYNCANSENMIEVFKKVFNKLIDDYLVVSKIKFYETPTSYITWERNS